jgi:hypothetical protein
MPNNKEIRASVYRDGPAKSTKDAVRSYEKYFYSFHPEYYIDKEILHTDLPAFEKYRFSKILIAGGGPSTQEIAWKPEEYDYIWSLNHFFLNDRLKDIGVSLATICAEVDLTSPAFQEYTSIWRPQLGFEIHASFNKHKHKSLVNSFYHKDSLFGIYTRFYSKLGGGVRLALLAHSLGVREVHFVGMDGPQAINEGRHAFQAGKKTLPPVMMRYNLSERINFFTQQYREFANYFQNTLRSTTKLQNLSEYYPGNVLAAVSKQEFPLDEDVKENLYSTASET